MKRNPIVSEVEGLLTDGDAGFVGVNQLAPGPGEVAHARNARFVTTEQGEEVAPRLGVAKLPWTNRVTSTSTTAQPFGTVYGAGEFRDADDLRWVIIAADGKVYRTRENSGAAEVTLPAGTFISSEVSFEQTVNGLVMFRGKDLPELLMRTLDLGFEPMDLSANVIGGVGTENPSDGTELIPNASFGAWIGNRLFVPYESGSDKDLVAISDYLNATRYFPIRSQGRINQGSADRLLAVAKYNEQQAVCFKEASAYVLTGIQGDLNGMRLDEVTKAYGLAGAKAWARLGKDLWYLAPKVGIASIEITIAGKSQGVDVPASATIQRIIDRIDWRNASASRFAFWNNMLFCAMPLDDSKVEGLEMVGSSDVYSTTGVGAGFSLYRGVVGATYRWEKGTHEHYIDLGSGSVFESGDLECTNAAIAMVGDETTAVTASLKRVYSGTNNAVVVYDTLKQHWAGYYDGLAMMVKEWFKTTYQGQERLFFVSTDGFIHLMEELYFDEVAHETATDAGSAFVGALYTTWTVTPGELYGYAFLDTANFVRLENGAQVLTERFGTFAAFTTTIALTVLAAGAGFQLFKLSYTLDTEFIDFEVLTRPYRCGLDRWKRFQRVRPELRTWYPSWSLSAVTEGMREETTVKGPVTRDPAVYDKPAFRANWDRTNVNDDHAEPFRQDYSIVLGETTTPSGSIVAGLLYYVEDLTGAASITYNAVLINAPGTFTGVAGVATFVVSSGTPKVYGPGNYIFAGATGFEPDTHQEFNRPVKLPALVRGRQVQFRLTNDQGRCALLALGVEAVMGERKVGSYV